MSIGALERRQVMPGWAPDGAGPEGFSRPEADSFGLSVCQEASMRVAC